MYIKFANTDGQVFDNEDTHLDIPVEFGYVYTFEEGVIVVDRLPIHETTQLSVDKLIKLLRYILRSLYSSQLHDITIYLPRMDSNMIQQSDIQRKFSHLTNKLPLDDKIDSTENAFHITLIHI